MNLLIIFASLLVIVFAGPTQAQEASYTSGYRSQTDEDLTIRRLTLLPVTDNAEGIYARPLETELGKALRENHQFNFVEFTPPATGVPALSELEENTNRAQELAFGAGVDAFVAAHISKTPRGLNITLDLFLAKDGKLLTQETLREYPRFDLPEIKTKTLALHQQLLKRLPYEAVVLSRTENIVTLNLGERDGVKPGQIINAILTLRVQRHPKFNFLISSEKEILGKIQLTKVDDNLSFGIILSEKEKDAIHKFTKISDLDQVVYADARGLSSVDGEPAPPPGEEWLPTQPPTFGQVSLQLGLGAYTHKTSIDTVGGLEGRSSLYPQLQLTGEIWLTSQFLVRANFQQGIATFKNSREQSSPGNLTTIISSYNVSVGYNVLINGDFFGPKITVLLGLYQYRSTIDDSEPKAFTSMTYSGPVIGVEGVLPLEAKNIWALGAGVNFVLQPSLNESPVTSGGSPKNTINQFYLLGRKKISERVQGTATIAFDSHATAFNGPGSRTDSVTTDSQTSTVLACGIHYLF